MSDGVLLARAAITGILEPAGWKAFIGFLKQNPGAVMPAMPFSLFIEMVKERIVFSVSEEAHADHGENE